MVKILYLSSQSQVLNLNQPQMIKFKLYNKQDQNTLSINNKKRILQLSPLLTQNTTPQHIILI